MKKQFIAVACFILISLVGLFLWQEIRFNDGKLHIVFCNVGQGDAIFIRTPQKTDILIDGGPDSKVLDCLSGHMPFWDRTIDFVILTHPHQDHFAGLIDVLQRYTVKAFGTEKLVNTSNAFTAFTQVLKQKKLEARHLFFGDRVKTPDGVRLQVLAPTVSFLTSSSPAGTIGESGEFGSLVLLLSYGNFRALFTGDAQAEGIKEGLGGIEGLEGLDVLQVPHHGSKTGLDGVILAQLAPRLAVISVGQNSYGHPSGELMKILRDKDITILRTDQHGEVEIISDGRTWKVK